MFFRTINLLGRAMNNYSCIVFDLDGTLMKSADTIYDTMIDTFRELNINTTPDRDKFNTMIGWHFLDIFNELGIDVPDVEHFITIYKTKYFNHINSSELFDGVTELLDYLVKNSYKVALLTTKGQEQADKIIDAFDLRKYFDLVVGRKPELKIKPAPDSLVFITDKLNQDMSNTLMVGDTEMDILCAQNAGCHSCAVSFGYRSLDELKKLDPVYIIDSYKEFYGILENDTNR